MRRTIVAAIILGLLAGSLVAPAEAGKKKKKATTRTAEGSYDMPALVLLGACAQTGAIGCVTFATAKEESWITKLKITDQHGMPVYAELAQNLDGDNISETDLGAVCGKLKEPVQFKPGFEVYVWILTPPRDPTCVPGQGTSGQVKITFSNKA
ncbi:MAG: hypothetical protein ACRDJJ_03105 [Actinomycetota bacterium]